MEMRMVVLGMDFAGPGVEYIVALDAGSYISVAGLFFGLNT